jgi:hypothetical protein
MMFQLASLFWTTRLITHQGIPFCELWHDRSSTFPSQIYTYFHDEYLEKCDAQGEPQIGVSPIGEQERKRM